MADRKRITYYYVLALVVALVGFTIVYNLGMRTIEERPQPLFNSLQVVVQTFTTVGYGEDAPWRTPAMTLLVVAMQLSGIGLIFAALPVFIVPLLEDALAPTPSEQVEGVSNHVIICEYTSRSEALISELERWNVPYVVVESDRNVATDLDEAGHAVVHGDPESVDMLISAGVAEAFAVVADDTDETNTSIVLAAREASESVRAISVVESEDLAEYHRYAGADQVLSPRRLVGERLAKRALSAVSTELSEATDLGKGALIDRLFVQKESELDGRTIAESAIEERTGARVVGAWIDGGFDASPAAETTLDETADLLVVGSKEQLEATKQLTLAATYRDEGAEVVVVGVDEIGTTVADSVRGAGVSVTTLDDVRGAEADETCDVTDPDAVDATSIPDAHFVVLTLVDDTRTMFATLVVRERNPEARIVACVDESENVSKVRRAGADFVVALTTTSGRMISAAMYEGEDTSLGRNVRLVHTNAERIAGKTIADVRTEAGVSVVAVERGREVATALDSSLVLRRDDTVTVVGADEDMNRVEWRRMGENRGDLSGSVE